MPFGRYLSADNRMICADYSTSMSVSGMNSISNGEPAARREGWSPLPERSRKVQTSAYLEGCIPWKNGLSVADLS